MRAIMTLKHKIKENISRPITVTHTKKNWIVSKYGINISVSYWLMIWATYSFFKSFYSISIHSQPVKFNQVTENYDLLSLQRRNPVDSRFWSRLCYYCSKWSWPKYNNQLTRNTPSCLAIAVISKTRLFEQSSSESTNYCETRGNNGDERGSTLQCGAQDLNTSSYQVSHLKDIEFNWGNWQLDMDAVFGPGIDTPFSPTTFNGVSMGGSVENPLV